MEEDKGGRKSGRQWGSQGHGEVEGSLTSVDLGPGGTVPQDARAGHPLPPKGTWLILKTCCLFHWALCPMSPLWLWPVGPRGPLAPSLCLFVSGTRGLQAAFDTGTAHPIQ